MTIKNIKDIGTLLKKTREGKNLTIDTVYKKTHIHPRILKSLEDGAEEPTLSRVYMKGFVRKYADFLGVDSDGFIKDYEKQLPSDTNQRIFIEPKEEPTVDIKKYIRPLTISLVSVLCVVFIFIAVVKIERAIVRSVRNLTHKPVKEKAAPKAEAQAKVAEKPAAEKQILEETHADMILLSVASTDEVWMSVRKDDEVVFNGSLPKNSKERWYADKQLVLRVGKLEALDFTVNDKNVGKIGKGVKDIVIDKKGIKVEGKYIRIKD